MSNLITLTQSRRTQHLEGRFYAFSDRTNEMLRQRRNKMLRQRHKFQHFQMLYSSLFQAVVQPIEYLRKLQTFKFLMLKLVCPDQQMSLFVADVTLNSVSTNLQSCALTTMN